MYISLYTLFAFTLLCYFGALGTLFRAQSSANDLSNTIRLLYVLASVVFVVFYCFWESSHGCAFSYWFPLHGSRRVSRADWRFGILIRFTLSAVFLKMATLIFLTADSCLLADRPLYDDVAIFACFSVRTFLLAALSTAPLSLVLLLYASAPQYYSPPNIEQRQ